MLITFSLGPVNTTFAKLAFLHLVRAEQLAPKENGSRNAIRERAKATILAAKLPVYELVIDADPQIDPQLFMLLRLCLAGEVRQRSGENVSWQFGKPGVDSGNAKIYLSTAEVHIPNPSDLHEVTSSYLSHFEDVPNPRRPELKRQLVAQDLAVSLALSSYNSAVSSYNIYPTDYGLQSVNRARTNYNYAIDRYNDLVNLYNSTPATISSPVYLPYKFSQGTVAFGFKCQAKISVGNHVSTAAANNVTQSDVRLGTRVNDRNPSTRRDVPLTMDISSEAFFRKSDEVSSKLTDALGEALMHLNPYEGLAEDEQMGLTAAWLLHPFGPQASISASHAISPWITQSAKGLVFPKADIHPPVTRVNAPQLPPGRGLNAQKLSEYYGDLVCTINASGPLGSSFGSGVAISGEGVILTCAHVLEGKTITASFFRDGREVCYQTELLFVNEKADDNDSHG